jgi:ribosomal protein S18 acetylase RimI-like enzyme
VTEATFTRLLGDDRLFAFVAETDGAVCGFVHCVLHPATWSLSNSCYLEDLYVDPSVRGGGVGRALIEAVYEAAGAKGADRVYWLTHQTNQQARILYDKVASFDGFVQYRRKL